MLYQGVRNPWLYVKKTLEIATILQLLSQVYVQFIGLMLLFAHFASFKVAGIA